MMRETGRVTRATRLPPVQRLAQVSERIRRWLNELSPRVKTQATPVLVKKTEALKQPETIASPVTREQKRQDLREKLRQDIGQHRKQQQNRSRGIRM
jgi:hypothetical protein